MIDRLINFLRDLPAGDKARKQQEADDPRVAAAALMFHVMDADGVRQQVERDRLSQMLVESYSIDGDDLRNILDAGEAADREAIDLYSFTSVLKRNLDAVARSEFIRILWEIVYADGERHELEENVVWRVAELIGVERAERVALRQSVEAALASKDGE